MWPTRAGLRTLQLPRYSRLACAEPTWKCQLWTRILGVENFLLCPDLPDSWSSAEHLSMSFEVLWDLAPVCSENRRLKKIVVENCHWRLAAGKNVLGKRSLRTSASFSLWSRIRSAPSFFGKSYPCFSIDNVSLWIELPVSQPFLGQLISDLIFKLCLLRPHWNPTAGKVCTTLLKKSTYFW